MTILTINEPRLAERNQGSSAVVKILLANLTFFEGTFVRISLKSLRTLFHLMQEIH